MYTKDWTSAEKHFMEEALSLADEAFSINEIPVGAVVVYDGRVVGRGYNCPIRDHDPTAHAEICALRQASHYFQNYRLPRCDLYVTLEPCLMCCGAIIHSRIKTLYFGTKEPKSGVVCSHAHVFSHHFLNHKVQFWGGLCAEQSKKKLQDFFCLRRRQKK